MNSLGDVTRLRWVRRRTAIAAWIRRRYLPLVVLALAVAVIVLAVALRNHFPSVRGVGYPAVFLLSFFSSASLAVPFPGIAAVCTGGVLLMPLLVGLAAGVAEATGELSGYAVGYAGRGLVEKRRSYLWMEGWMRRRGPIVLFVLSVVPNPLFDLAGIAAGVARYPIWQFYGVVLVGKTIKSVAVAYTCALGYETIVSRFS